MVVWWHNTYQAECKGSVMLRYECVGDISPYLARMKVKGVSVWAVPGVSGLSHHYHLTHLDQVSANLESKFS